MKSSGVPQDATKKRRGCLVWGCLTSLFLVLMATSSAGFLAYRFLTRQVKAYTAEAAVELPEVAYSDDDMAQLEKRLREVAEQQQGNTVPPDVPLSVDSSTAESVERKGAAAKPAAGDLVLSARDLNALIGRNPQLRGKVFVTIEEGQIGGEVSIPMPDVPGGEGRFFNASASFDVAIIEGQLVVTLTDAYVKGEKAPTLLVSALAGENLAREINENPRLRSKLEKFESISVVEDKVILRSKKKTESIGSTDDESSSIAQPADS